MSRLNEKVALVTGGSRGIGAAIARALADEGADVALSYVASPDQAKALVRELQGKGVRAVAFQADQANASQVTQLVRKVVENARSGLVKIPACLCQCRRTRVAVDKLGPELILKGRDLFADGRLTNSTLLCNG